MVKNAIPNGNTPFAWSATTATVSASPETLEPYTSAASIAAIDGKNDFAQSASAPDLVALGDSYDTRVILKPGTSGKAWVYVNLTGAPNKEVKVNSFSTSGVSTTDPDVYNLAMTEIGGGFWRLAFTWIAPISDPSVQLRVGPFSAVAGEDVHVIGGWIDGTSPWVPESKPIRFTELGCPAVDRGTNQPNVFFDPKSAEAV